MTDMLFSRQDIAFLLYDWLKVEELTSRERYADHSRETFDAALDLCEQLATEHFATHNKKADANEPRFVDGKVEMIPEPAAALKLFGEAGLFAAHADYDIGGMQLPATVHSACFACWNSVNSGPLARALSVTSLKLPSSRKNTVAMSPTTCCRSASRKSSSSRYPPTYT